jgi:MHS family proline/betaine transporter-like MFS transporter
MIGNALEWYEFTLYGYFASIIGKLFFPTTDPVASLIAAFAVFSAGFLMRPLGAVIFGHIGDKMGRKKALLISIYLMALPTALIGLMPTYHDIGWMASVLLTVIRLLQGISIGGEFTGSMVFIIEHSPDHKRGLSGSYACLSLAIGIILGSTTAASIFALFSEQAIYEWAWRIPFLMSVFGAVIGAVMRRTLHDPKIYAEQQEKKTLHAMPVKELLAHNYKPLLHAISIELVLAVGFYIITIFLITYMKDFLKITESVAFRLNTINTIIFALMIPIAGWLSDKYGRRAVMMPAILSLLVFSYPLIAMMSYSPMHAFLGQMGLAVALGILFGPIPALLVELFPLKVRYSALSLAHSLSMSIFGGTAPLLVTQALKMSGDLMMPAYFLIISAAGSAVGLWFLRDRYKEPLVALN